MRLNNKGQSLVMFVLLIPIFVLIMVLVVDIGNIVSLRLELNNINKIVISSGLDDMDNLMLESEIKELVLMNNEDIDNISIKIEDNKIEVSLSDYSHSVFGRIVGFQGYEVTSNYVGYMEEDKKVIRGLR